MQPLLLVGAPSNAAPSFVQQRVAPGATHVSTEQLPAVVYSGSGLAFPLLNPNSGHNHFGAWHTHPHCSANHNNSNLMYTSTGTPWLQQSLMTTTDLFQANNAATVQQVAVYGNTPSHTVSVSRCGPHVTNHSTLQSLFSTPIHTAHHNAANLRHQQNLLASTAAAYHPATLLTTANSLAASGLPSATQSVNAHVWHTSNHPSFHTRATHANVPHSQQAMWTTTTSFAPHPDLLLHFLAMLGQPTMSSVANTLASSMASAAYNAFRSAPTYYHAAMTTQTAGHQQQPIFVPQASSAASGPQLASMQSQLSAAAAVASASQVAAAQAAAHHRYIQQQLHAAGGNIDSLLHLAAHMSDNKPRGLNKAELESIPTYLICESDRDPGKEQVTCVVCMCEFEARQKLRTLHCGHEFHTKCVDRWLKHNRSCPICRADALSGTKQETVD